MKLSNLVLYFRCSHFLVALSEAERYENVSECFDAESACGLDLARVGLTSRAGRRWLAIGEC